MAVSPITGRAARGLDLVAMFSAHAALHDARDRRPGADPATAHDQAARAGGPPSAALVHPMHRPAFLVPAGARGGQAQRRVAQTRPGAATSTPHWHRNPTDDGYEALLRSHPVHGRRPRAAYDDSAGAARQALPTAPAGLAAGAAAQLARKAVLERARFLASLRVAA